MLVSTDGADYQFKDTNLPPGYVGMAPGAGLFARSGDITFCNAIFKHPKGNTLFILNSLGEITSVTI